MDTRTLHPDFKDLLNLLNEEQVEYLLIGGYAVAVYGYPRGTVDIDLWIAVSPENVDRIMRTMFRFGFANSVEREWFLDPDRTVRLGHIPYRVEFIKKISGVEFAHCFARRMAAIVDGVPTQVISLEDLKLNKKAAGRDKDLNDLKNV